MQELYRINVIQGGWNENYTIHTEDKRLFDLLNGTQGTPEIPDWWSPPKDWDVEPDEELEFYNVIESLDTMVKYPYIVLEEGDWINVQ